MNRVRIEVDGRPVDVPAGATLAAALLGAGIDILRTSVTGTPRGPVCGMGTCFECRVTIDDTPHQRACLVDVRAGMRVKTGGAA